MTIRKWLLMPAAAAMLAVGMAGGHAAYADTGTGTAPPTATEAPETTNEAPESTTPEPNDANEPALPGGGHDDGEGANVDNQFDGVQ
ncbi:MAG: hypothetical protein M3Z65_00920 [Chloroflexota bacterium]|nr:hypothetical protein [Chloroflexota bacterium]